MDKVSKRNGKKGIVVMACEHMDSADVQIGGSDYFLIVTSEESHDEINPWHA